MTRIYLDSNILIAHFSTDPAEESKKELVKKAFTAFAEVKNVKLCTSMWAVTEMMNILVSSKKMEREDVFEIESQLVGECRLGDLKLHFLAVSPRDDYDFQEFFYHVRQAFLAIILGSGT